MLLQNIFSKTIANIKKCAVISNKYLLLILNTLGTTCILIREVCQLCSFLISIKQITASSNRAIMEVFKIIHHA